LAGRTITKIDALAKEIPVAGGVVETAEVDALDDQAVEKHASAVADQAGDIDVSFNAVGIPQKGVRLLEPSPENFAVQP
jgi:3-oxoacyl-[acyl-carrier protein] reductase